MKRNRIHPGAAIGSILLAVVMLFAVSPAASAAGPLFHSQSYPEFRFQPVLPEPTIEGLYKANAYDSLLEKYGGFGVETFANRSYIDGEGYSFFYGTENCNFYCNAMDNGDQPALATLTTETDVFRLTVNEDGSTEFSLDWSVEPDWQSIRHSLREEAMALDEEALLANDIISVEDNGDGTLTLVLGDAAVNSAAEPAAQEFPQYNTDEQNAFEYGVDDYGYTYDDGFTYDAFDSFGYGYDSFDDFGYGYDDFADFDDGGYRGFDDFDYGYGHDAFDDYPCSFDCENCRRAEFHGRGRFFGDSPFADEFYPDWNSWSEDTVPDYTGDDAWLHAPSVEADPYNAPIAADIQNDFWTENGMSLYDDQSNRFDSASEAEPLVLTTLTVDAATLEILKTEQKLMLEDGSEELLLVQIMSYSCPESALMSELLERSAPYMTGENLKDPRTVTVVYNPGTDDETVCTRTVEKGDLLSATFAAGYQLCADEQGTPFVGGDAQNDVTVYAFPADHIWPYPVDSADIDAADDDLLPVPDGETALVAEVLPAEDEMPVVIVENSEYSAEAEEAPLEDASDEGALAEQVLPVEILPEEAQSEETLTEEALPVQVLPVEILPEETQSEETLTEEALPVQVLPVEVLPVEPIPAETPAEEVLPVQILPTDTLPEDMLPEEDPEEIIAHEADPGETDVAGEDDRILLDVDEVNRAIFEANQLEKILTNHDSVEYRLVFDTENTPGWRDYVYETKDMAYAESPNTSAYVGNGRYYELAEDDNGPELFYVFDFWNNYDPIANVGYEIVPSSYEEWWNPDEETAVDCYVTDGEIHLFSVSTPEKSRDFIEGYLAMPWQGELVSSERIADAETFELIRYTYRVEKDGESSDALVYEVSYDLPEPRACRTLRMIAERDAAQVATIKLVMNPGTENEIVQTMTIPVGSNVVYIAEEWMAMYEDPECTIPAQPWDKLNDHTFYMIPSSES